MKLETRRFRSRDELDAALAQRLGEALAQGGAPSAIMLSGGSTPMPAYRRVAAEHPRHSESLHVLFSDDRYVPSDSEASNYYQSRPLLDALSLREDALLRVPTELPLQKAAEEYERRLRKLLDAGIPISLGLLGLGADGHTASLFTGEDLERARGHLAIAVERPDGLSGISVTPEFLRHVESVLFVVAGGGKYDALQKLMREDPHLTAWRAVRDCPRVELWVDQASLFSLMA